MYPSDHISFIRVPYTWARRPPCPRALSLYRRTGRDEEKIRLRMEGREGEKMRRDEDKNGVKREK